MRITDAEGVPFDIDRERGQRTVMLFFGYTHCPDVCPATLADWARAKQAMGSAAANVLWLFVSVDPTRDTPQVARDYARQFDSTFVGLAPTAVQLDSLKSNWGFEIANEVIPGGPGYAVSHPAGTFVIDREGRIRLIFSPNTPPADIAADLRQLR